MLALRLRVVNSTAIPGNLQRALQRRVLGASGSKECSVLACHPTDPAQVHNREVAKAAVQASVRQVTGVMPGAAGGSSGGCRVSAADCQVYAAGALQHAVSKCAGGRGALCMLRAGRAACIATWSWMWHVFLAASQRGRHERLSVRGVVARARRRLCGQRNRLWPGGVRRHGRRAS